MYYTEVTEDFKINIRYQKSFILKISTYILHLSLCIG